MLIKNEKHKKTILMALHVYTQALVNQRDQSPYAALKDLIEVEETVRTAELEDEKAKTTRAKRPTKAK